MATEVELGATFDNESFDQLGQSVAALADGGWAAAWRVGDFPETDVRMQWIDSSGNPRFEEGGRTVAGLPGFFEDSAVVVAHPSAGAFVGFTRREVGVSVGRLFVQSFDGSGQPRWSGDGVQPIVVADSLMAPHLVADAAGGVYVCAQRLQEGRVWCQHLDANGERSWGEGGISTGDRLGRKVVPRGLLGVDDDLLIFWRNQRDPQDDVTEPVLMEGQRFGQDGTRHWGDLGLVIRTTAFEEFLGHGFNFYSVAPDGGGGAIVAFNDRIGDGEEVDVVAQRVAADGSLPWSGLPEGIAVVVAGTEDRFHNATAAGPNGGVFVSVSQDVSSSQSNLRLYYLDASAMHAWRPEGIPLSNPASPASDYGSSGSFDDGILRFAWTHQLAPSSFEYDIHLARFRLDGTPLDPLGGVPLTTAPNAQFSRQVAFSGNTLFAVWDDRRKGTSSDMDVYGGLFAAEIVFSDGFELGDLSAWGNP